MLVFCKTRLLHSQANFDTSIFQISLTIPFSFILRFNVNIVVCWDRQSFWFWLIDNLLSTETFHGNAGLKLIFGGLNVFLFFLHFYPPVTGGSFWGAYMLNGWSSPEKVSRSTVPVVAWNLVHFNMLLVCAPPSRAKDRYILIKSSEKSICNVHHKFIEITKNFSQNAFQIALTDCSICWTKIST